MKKFFIILVIFLIFANLSLSQKRFVVNCPKALITQSYKHLKSEVGKKEIGYNRGIADIYNRSIGNPLGSSYCQAGQYWCYWVSCNELKLLYSNIPMPRNGMANSTYNFGKQHGYSTSYHAAKHDFIIWKSIRDNSGHIERVIEVKAGGWVNTIGFNTGLSNDNGEGVAYRHRNISFPLTRIKTIRGLIGVHGV